MKEYVFNVISEIADVPVENIKEDSKVIDELKISCVGRCKLQIFFRDHIDVLMPSILAAKCETVKDVIDYMYEHQEDK